MFRAASTDLDHALVVCDLTQMLAEGSVHLDYWSHEQYIPYDILCLHHAIMS